MFVMGISFLIARYNAIFVLLEREAGPLELVEQTNTVEQILIHDVNFKKLKRRW
jgi:hypothetical protein